MYANPLDPRARESRRRHYEKNKQQYIDRSRASRKEKRNYLRDLKTSQPCTDCGLFYPYYVMQFDHIADNKVSDIARLINTGWAKLLAEIDKCELVCANCHAERTWQRAQVARPDATLEM